MIQTMGSSFRRALAVNSTSATFPVLAETHTTPSGAGVFTLDDMNGGVVQNGIRVVPYSLGATNDTYSIRVTGWSSLDENDPIRIVWVPVTIVEYACTAGASVRFFTATEHFADTLVLTTGDAGVTTDTVSPADDTVAHFMSDVKGFQKIQFTFQIGTGPTSMNALFALL